MHNYSGVPQSEFPRVSLSGSIQGFNVVQEKVKISKFSKISKIFQKNLKIIKSNLFFLNVQNFQKWVQVVA